jgi:hypothetical protein
MKLLKGQSHEILWYVFWYQTIELKFVHTRSVFVCFKISFSCRIFDFRVSAYPVMSLPWEWSWALRLSNPCFISVLGAHYGAHVNAGVAV